MKTRNTLTLGILTFLTATLGIGTTSLLAGGGTTNVQPSTQTASGGLTSGLYYKLEGGVNLATPLKLSRPVAGLITGQVSMKTGFRVSGTAGYAYKVADKLSLALELEVGVLYNSLKTVSGSVGAVSATAPINGDYVQVPILGNVVISWEVVSNWIVFAGGGAGYDALFLSTGNGPGRTGAEGQFAWQVIGGTRYHFSNSWDLGVTYKYLAVQPSGFKTQGNHAVLGAFTFHF